MKKKCKIEGCARDHFAKGLCNKHYTRLWKGGDPNIPSRFELTPEERFRAKLGPKDPVTGCIEWAGGQDKDGYGYIRKGGKTAKTHRLAWELKHGPIPDGLHVLHRCDNPPCCNDVHLFLGTNTDNVVDKTLKCRGNQPKGEAHWKARLTEADVAEIRLRLARGEQQNVIAEDFGVSGAHVSAIKSGKAWKY